MSTYTYRIQDDAIALFDGGWRSCDADELQGEYGFTDYELAEIIACIKEMESGDADWADDDEDETR